MLADTDIDIATRFNVVVIFHEAFDFDMLPLWVEDLETIWGDSNNRSGERYDIARHQRGLIIEAIQSRKIEKVTIREKINKKGIRTVVNFYLGKVSHMSEADQREAKEALLNALGRNCRATFGFVRNKKLSTIICDSPQKD